MSTKAYEDSADNEFSDSCLKTALSLLINIVETACEHESDLELMRLINFMDLYRTYLACVVLPQDASDTGSEQHVDRGVLQPVLGTTRAVSFEQFISDSHLLAMAAAEATKECGVVVATPPPLKLSANGAVA